MHLYGLIVGISTTIGINFFLGHNRNISKSSINRYVAGGLVFALIGARLYHIIDQWPYYSNNLWQIPQIWLGGLGIIGAIIGVTIFILIFTNPKSYLTTFDSITPILPLCQAIGRLGNWINRENPYWWLEASLNLLLYLLIRLFPGQPTSKYLIGYGFIRYYTEYFRQDTWQINSTKIGQLFSIIFIIMGIVLWKKIKKLPISN